MFDYVYNAFKTFPTELISTAKVLGLSSVQIAKKVQFPIIFRQLLPQIIVLFSFILQATIFCSFISVGELFKKAQEINADIFKPIELYSIVALFFISICLFINLLSLYFKRKYSYDLNKY
jgi:ABC-type amino acid transport system permease subunit